MSSEHFDPLANLERPPSPDRPYYAEGVLLDAADLTAEQTYHRGRLARALAWLHGHGTVAGLRLLWEEELPFGDPEAPEGREERLRVEPGLAVDPLGRLVEIPRSACLRLERWYQSQEPSALRAALNGAETAVRADLLLRFVPCARGKTPAFASGPFDATDAIAPARLRDAYELELVPATSDTPPVATSLWQDVDPVASPAVRRDQLREAIYDSWAAAPASHDIFLGRVEIPATLPGDPDAAPDRTGGASVTVDDSQRPFLAPSAALSRWVGI